MIKYNTYILLNKIVRNNNIKLTKFLNYLIHYYIIKKYI